jgi:hypothetical protein
LRDGNEEEQARAVITCEITYQDIRAPSRC